MTPVFKPAQYSMFHYLVRDKRTFAFLAGDLFAIIGVLALDWNPARLVGFYYIDICICILAFAFYNIIIGSYTSLMDVVAFIFGMGTVMFGCFMGMIGLTNRLGIGTIDTAEGFLFPYFDVGMFLTFSSIAHIYNVRKYLTYRKEVSRPAFTMHTVITFFIVPGLLFLAYVLMFCRIPPAVALVISLILLRHYTEYKRYRGFAEIEAENTWLEERDQQLAKQRERN